MQLTARRVLLPKSGRTIIASGTTCEPRADEKLSLLSTKNEAAVRRDSVDLDVRWRARQRDGARGRLTYRTNTVDIELLTGRPLRVRHICDGHIKQLPAPFRDSGNRGCLSSRR